MKELHALVADLLSIGDGPPVISLYLDTAWKDEQQRSRVRLFFQDRAREARRLFGESVARTLNEIEPWLDDVVNQVIHPETKGIALFASADRDLFIEHQVPTSFDLEMFVDSRPRIFPFARTLSRDFPALLVTVDSEGANIREWQLGGVVDRQIIHRDIPNRHRRGGWSAFRIAHHIRWHIQGVWRECARALEQRLLLGQPGGILLFGQESNIRNFERLLSPAARAQIIGMHAAEPGEANLLAAAERLLDEERTARDFAAVHRILRQGLSDRVGTVGLDQTIEASNERQIHLLTMSDHFDMTGSRCEICDALSRSGATGCVFCGGETKAVSLREELVRRCLTEGGDIRIVAGGGPLDAYDGIGSLLRHLKGRERRTEAGLSAAMV